jgi:hypothetical protein
MALLLSVRGILSVEIRPKLFLNAIKEIQEFLILKTGGYIAQSLKLPANFDGRSVIVQSKQSE